MAGMVLGAVGRAVNSRLNLCSHGTFVPNCFSVAEGRDIFLHFGEGRR